MHEAGIAKNILDKVIEEADRNGGGRVKSVRLRIGELAQIMDDALRFSFDALSKGTCAEGSSLKIDAIPFTVRCGRCGWEGECDIHNTHCGRCDGRDVETSGGDEICLMSFTLETDD